MNIDKEFDINKLKLIKYLQSIDSPFLIKIKQVYEHVKEILNHRIQYVFPNYTLHDTGHSFRIMEYMAELVSDLSKLSQLEVALMVYAALLHDIGMAVGEEDLNNIKSDNFSFCDVKFSAMKKIMKGDEQLATQEYVRRIHSSLSAKYIRENLKKDLVIPKLVTLDFTEELALICEAHTKDYDWIKTKLQIKEVKGDYSINPQFIALILRLADILDIDSNRTPYNLYKLISPKEKSDEEWKQHFVISNNKKIILNESTQQKKIVFHGKATNASIHRKILAYISCIQDELTNAVTLVKSMPIQYSLMYETTPEINIQTEGYTFSDYKMTLEFRAISSLLMGEKIYGSKSLGLRELIQNSIDACRLRQEKDLLKLEFGEDVYNPKIKIILDAEKKTVTIKDNGIGMSLDVIKKHFLNVGVSYYNSTDFLLKDYTYKPIGNFGIGFLSCFMLSDEVRVLTRYSNSKNKYLIELERGNEWTSLTETEDVTFEGTEVILSYSNFMQVFNDKIESVHKFLNTYFLTDGIVFELINKTERKIDNINNSINTLIPLDKGIVKINFQDYFKEIEGYALIKYKNNFITKFDDIVFVGDLYQYDDYNGLQIVEDGANIEIDNYINGNEFKYLTIPLVKNDLEDDYLSGMRFTNDDVKEVLEKLDRKLSWISIVVHKNDQNFLSAFEIGKRDSIFEELVKLGHSESCKTQSTVRTITLFEGRKNNMYLPFDKIDNTYYHFFYRNENNKKLFIRSVLIKDFVFGIPTFASVFEITEIVLNINSRKIIPDISRNNVDAKEYKIINYMVGKAIHLGARNSLSLNQDEKNTLDKFISEFYSKKTEYEK